MPYQPTELIKSVAVVATGNTIPFKISTHMMLVVGVDVTAVTGTTPTLDIWLQAADDDGVTFYDLPYDRQLATSAAAADLTANTNKRNINGTSSCTAVNRYLAEYKHTAAGFYRLAYVLSGTAPSFTLSVNAAGK